MRIVNVKLMPISGGACRRFIEVEAEFIPEGRTVIELPVWPQGSPEQLDAERLFDACKTGLREFLDAELSVI